MNRRRFLAAAAATPAAAFIPDGGGTGTGTGGTTPPPPADRSEQLRDLYNQGAITRNNLVDAIVDDTVTVRRFDGEPCYTVRLTDGRVGRLSI